MIVTFTFSLFCLFGFCHNSENYSFFPEGCDDGWIPFRGHCYLFSDDRLSWYAAKVKCNQKKGYLARVESQIESMWLKAQARILTREYTWLGGTDAGHEGIWMWESNMKKVEYTDFLKGQPDNGGGNENCLEMYSIGKTGAYTWNDLNCDVQRKFVCEKGVKKNPCEFIGRKSFARGRPLTIINNYKEK